MSKLDLDVSSPDQVAGVLRRAAEAYRVSDAELSSAWQEKAAGYPWARVARILDQTADRIARLVGDKP